jgi:hypothetical protein
VWVGRDPLRGAPAYLWGDAGVLYPSPGSSLVSYCRLKATALALTVEKRNTYCCVFWGRLTRCWAQHWGGPSCPSWTAALRETRFLDASAVSTLRLRAFVEACLTQPACAFTAEPRFRLVTLSTDRELDTATGEKVSAIWRKGAAGIPLSPSGDSPLPALLCGPCFSRPVC